MTPTSALSAVLPKAQFTERHSRLIRADRSQVWAALDELTWSDLGATRGLFAVRGLSALLGAAGPASGSAVGTARPGIFRTGPFSVVDQCPPLWMAGFGVARPWQLVPDRADGIDSVQAFADFGTPGWLKMAMDVCLESVPEGIQVTTTTACAATDDVSARRFGRYWRLIRPFSGLIRRDLLISLDRRAQRLSGAP